MAELLTHLVIDAGNPLGNSSYKNDVNKICHGLDRWTKMNYHVSFKNMGRVMPIGTQQDTISCGVCVLNALENATLGVDLFTHNRRNNLRMHCFKKIMGLLVDSVSVVKFSVF